MLQIQMSERCPSSEYVGNAQLNGFRLGFPITSRNRGGMGVASVLESTSTDVVEGVVFRLSKDDLLRLDQFESLGIQYSRKWRCIDIQKPNGAILRGEKICYYVAISDDTHHYLPSLEYKNCLVQGAKEHGLSEQYIAKLECIETEKLPR